MYPTPGLSQFVAASSLDTRPIAAMAAFYGRLFVISPHHAYSIDPTTGTPTLLGSVVTNAGPPGSIAANNVGEVLFCWNQALFLYNVNTTAFTSVGGSLAQEFARVAFVDGYFIATVQASSRFYISGLEDGTTWNALDFASVSEYPGWVMDMCVSQRQIWLLGSKQSVAYFDSGAANFPFEPIPGSLIEQGAMGELNPFENSYTATVVDNTLFWIGADSRGGLMAWKMAGYTPQRISNFAVEYAWQSYGAVNADQTTAFSYQQYGHIFWVVQFSADNAPGGFYTWVYDAATGLWHERTHFVNGVHNAWLPTCHCYIAGQHFVGAYDGAIYKIGAQYTSDNGNPIVRVRRAPHISSEQQWMFHQQLQVYLESGLGTSTASVGPQQNIILRDVAGVAWALTVDNSGFLTTTVSSGYETVVILQDSVTADYYFLQVTITGNIVLQPVRGNIAAYQTFALIAPNTSVWLLTSQSGMLQTQSAPAIPPQISLRWSNDGGHTWSNYYAVSAGNIGEYTTRCMWRRLGRARDRIYEITTSDAIPWRIVDSYLQAEPGFQTTPRLVDRLKQGA